MFKKILIANRSEIACRVIRTARRLGILTVAVYSDADEQAKHVLEADEAFYIGKSPSHESYLCGDKILEIALKCGAEAIHPGYGFLSENAAFAEKCLKSGICFIGPSADAIRAMGSKSLAKKIAEKAKVPLIPGYHGDDQNIQSLQKVAEKMGYPVLLKAAAGGGGKGMRVVNASKEFASAFEAAKREAYSSFADDTLLIEKYLKNPRHIEIQIFADKYGNVIHLFERDCSIQRRHQKIIEEAPAPGISEKLRNEMGKTAIALAREINYVGAGTLEFLVEEDKHFYFMEMNTRLQVEHPITEKITGIDLVEWQLRIAFGEKLPLKQSDLKINGHAFEVRIYAEDPANDFLPCTGNIEFLHFPEENEYVRIDTGLKDRDVVTTFYDPLLAKLIVCDKDRESAVRQLQQALDQSQIVSIITNLDLLSAISKNDKFIHEKMNTGYIAKHIDDLLKISQISNEALATATLFVLLKQKLNQEKSAGISYDPYSPWFAQNAWRSNAVGENTFYFWAENTEHKINIFYYPDHYMIQIGSEKIMLKGHFENDHTLAIILNNREFKAIAFELNSTLYLLFQGKRYQLEKSSFESLSSHHIADDKSRLTSPMPGKIIAILVDKNKKVSRGEPLAIVEAMKMEHTLSAPCDGIIKEWYFRVGDLVNEGVDLLDFEEHKNELA